MEVKRTHKRCLAGLLALLLSVSMYAIAEEAEATDAPNPEAIPVSELVTQPPKETEQPEEVPQAAEQSEAPAETIETPTPILPTSAPTVEATAEATLHPPADEEATPPPTEEPPAQALPSVTLKWDIEAEDGLLRLGDEIALKAEIVPEIEGLQLQWQVATKPAEDLKDNEPEWADIRGAQGSRYTFVLADGMQNWRWRLLITFSEGELAYSDEIKLPVITLETEAIEEVPVAVEDEALPGVEDGQPKPETVNDEAMTDALDGEAMPNTVENEAAQQEARPLPVASITFTASVPAEEITYGTEVTLVAEIQNPCEGMMLQWQYISAEAELIEEGWQAVADATESSYTYVVDEANAGRLWRLLITVPAEETENAVSNQDVAALSDAMEPTPTPDDQTEGGDSGTH